MTWTYFFPLFPTKYSWKLWILYAKQIQNTLKSGRLGRAPGTQRRHIVGAGVGGPWLCSHLVYSRLGDRWGCNPERSMGKGPKEPQQKPAPSSQRIRKEATWLDRKLLDNNFCSSRTPQRKPWPLLTHKSKGKWAQTSASTPPLPAECPRLQAKITQHTKNQADLKLSEKGQPRDADSKVAEVLELSGRDSKAAMTKSFNKQLQIWL